ncbi:MAG: hypothetical protein CM1200mP30_17660 [Pseudomonadota bacterium]|nr:MAG: hypothetical protein CM1200mP30_17660 [Pseudomonadota bacterium]
MALKVVDEAIQLYGGQGVSPDTPLSKMWMLSVLFVWQMARCCT